MRPHTSHSMDAMSTAGRPWSMGELGVPKVQWGNGAMTNIRTLASGLGINASGQVIGYGTPGGNGFLGLPCLARLGRA
jgi:hypothetical protein